MTGDYSDGRLVVCEIVLAEIARFFVSVDELRGIMSSLAIGSEPLGDVVCHMAGEVFQRYRKRGGTRDRMLADFLIGAHAQVKCARLLTRDRGFYRDYFPELVILDPSVNIKK